MQTYLYFIAGFLVTFGLGFLVKPFLAWLRSQIVIPRISTDPAIEGFWRELSGHPDVSGMWVGIFERTILFGALYMESWEAVGIWLVFKVAAKWEAWNHMGYVPDIPDIANSVRPLEWAFARRIWAAQGYATFVVGTAANVLLAAGGVFLAKNADEFSATFYAPARGVVSMDR
jgi:hypothetical protein